jgi:protein-S-isoprenylcysteine O-methyltransferase Ste14
MKPEWLVLVFLVVAIAERLWERGFSRRAVRGDVKMGWSYVAFHVLHALIYVGTAVESVACASRLHWAPVVAGWALFAVATWLRLTAIRTLGNFWSLDLEIRQNHQFVRQGIYCRMRHPAYSAIMMEVIAIPLVGSAWWTMILSVGLYIPLLLARWHVEEKQMVAKFGESYAQYRREVPAFWPGSARAK